MENYIYYIFGLPSPHARSGRVTSRPCKIKIYGAFYIGWILISGTQICTVQEREHVMCILIILVKIIYQQRLTVKICADFKQRIVKCYYNLIR